MKSKKQIRKQLKYYKWIIDHWENMVMVRSEDERQKVIVRTTIRIEELRWVLK